MTVGPRVGEICPDLGAGGTGETSHYNKGPLGLWVVGAALRPHSAHGGGCHSVRGGGPYLPCSCVLELLDPWLCSLGRGEGRILLAFLSLQRQTNRNQKSWGGARRDSGHVSPNSYEALIPGGGPWRVTRWMRPCGWSPHNGTSALVRGSPTRTCLDTAGKRCLYTREGAHSGIYISVL